MNICFEIGKIVSEIEYKFIIKSKNKAIVKLWIETSDCNKIYIVGYDDIADKIYSLFKKGDFISFYGKIENDKVIIEYLEEKIISKHNFM